MEIIIGAAVSLIVQLLKQKFTSQWQTLAFLLVLSIGAAGLYTVFVAVDYWATTANILIIAGAFYAYIIQRFETKSEGTKALPFARSLTPKASILPHVDPLRGGLVG
jgi:hypothetical protein